MVSPFWEEVAARDHEVPAGRTLEELTAELLELVGSADARTREDVAHPTLAAWITRGVYDYQLTELGDGLTDGLRHETADPRGDAVFRRSFSALGLAACLRREEEIKCLPAGTVLGWGDRLITWFLQEEDLRSHVPGKGWAHALAHGADALAALAGSRHLETPELVTLLDVLADRLLMPAPPLTHGEPDRIAQAVLSVLKRDQVSLAVVEPWVRRIRATADTCPSPASGDPFTTAHNPQQLLRALHLQARLGKFDASIRPDLTRLLEAALRATNQPYLD